MPARCGGPVTVRPSSVEVDRAAHPGQQVAQRVAGLGGLARPAEHGHGAARDGGEGQERGGVGQVGLDRGVPGGDRAGSNAPAVGLGVVDVDAVATQQRDGHLDVRHGRHRLAVVQHVHALVVGSAREQQRRDELRGRRRVDHDLPARHVAVAPDDERQGAPAVVVDRHAETAQRGEQVADRTLAHVRVAVEGHRPGGQRRDRRHEPQHRAGQSAVDRPRRGRTAPDVTAQSSAEVSTSAPSADSAVAISTVSRDRRARRTTEGPSARAAITSARLVRDLLPGSETATSTGPRARGAGHGSTYVVTRRSLVG